MNKNKLNSEDRKKNAIKWLSKFYIPQEKMLIKYIQRYNVEESVAFIELAEIGYYNEAQIGLLVKDGFEWNLQYDGNLEDFIVVRSNNKDEEEFQQHENYRNKALFE